MACILSAQYNWLHTLHSEPQPVLCCSKWSTHADMQWKGCGGLQGPNETALRTTRSILEALRDAQEYMWRKQYVDDVNGVCVCPSVRLSVRYARHVCACAKSRDMYFVMMRRQRRLQRRRQQEGDRRARETPEERESRRAQHATETPHCHKRDCVNSGVRFSYPFLVTSNPCNYILRKNTTEFK